MTAYSGLFDGVYGEPYALPTNVIHGNAMRIRKATKRAGVTPRIQRIILSALMSAGSSNLPTHRTSTSPSVSEEATAGEPIANGGMRVIDQVTIIDRDVTSNDLNAMYAAVNGSTAPKAVDLSGNGGGALFQ